MRNSKESFDGMRGKPKCFSVDSASRLSSISSIGSLFEFNIIEIILDQYFYSFVRSQIEIYLLHRNCSPLGGILIGVLGAAAVFIFNGGSYIVSGLLIVSVLLALSNRREVPKTTERPSFVQQLKGGFGYLNRERALLKITIASFGANFFKSFLHFRRHIRRESA